MKFVVPGTRIRGCSIIRRTSICAGLLNRFFSRRLKSRRNFCETEPPRYHFHSPEGGERRVKERDEKCSSRVSRFASITGEKKKKRKKYQDRLFSSIVNPARFNQPPYFVFRVSTLLDLVSVYKSCESSEEPPPGSGETPSQGRRERRWRGRKKRGTSEWNIIDSIIARVRILPGSGLAPQGNPPSVRNASVTNVTFDFTIFGAWPDLSKTFHTISSREKEEKKKKKKEERNLLIFLLLSNARAQTFTLSNDRALRSHPIQVSSIIDVKK